jgi:hypothetical protein
VLIREASLTKPSLSTTNNHPSPSTLLDRTTTTILTKPPTLPRTSQSSQFVRQLLQPCRQTSLSFLLRATTRWKLIFHIPTWRTELIPTRMKDLLRGPAREPVVGSRVLRVTGRRIMMIQTPLEVRRPFPEAQVATRKILTGRKRNSSGGTGRPDRRSDGRRFRR